MPPDTRRTPDAESPQAAIARRLREAREDLGLSQDEVARALGFTRPTVSAIEACKRQVTSVEMREFARLYRRDYDYLMDGTLVESRVDSALFRLTDGLSETDKEQVLRFARFLQSAKPIDESE